MSVGTGPWSDPIRVISFIDLFIDVDMQSVLLSSSEDSFRRIVVFLSCQRPGCNGSRIRLDVIVILRSRPKGFLSCERTINDLVIFFIYGTLRFLEGRASFLNVLASGGMLRLNWEKLTAHASSERLLTLILKNL